MHRKHCPGLLCRNTITNSVLLGTLLAALTLSAEDESPSKVSESLIEATRHAATLDVTLAEPKEGVTLKLSERALLTFGDPARDNEAGTLWTWSSGGRPTAMMELYRPTGEERIWVHAISMTSPRLARMTHKSGAKWTPRQSDFSPQLLSGEVTVSDTPVQRLRQMKEQVRRFAAHQFWDPNNSRFELRLLAQPVLRYVDADNNVLDGTLFVFAHGTNPEIALFLEAIGPDAARAKWHYAFARTGSAEFHVELDGKEVWHRDRAVRVTGAPVDTYWLFTTRRDE
ncbi:MAG: hypothetical protein JSS49_12795 [Planctomycetes bacterium]|nr:hypothetical protein [Planctomycetota bacterium]